MKESLEKSKVDNSRVQLNVSLIKTLTTVTDQPTVYVCDIPLFLLHFLHSIFIARALEVVVYRIAGKFDGEFNLTV